MKKARVKGLNNDKRQSTSTTSNLKVISFYAALLVVVTALLGLYIAWVELVSPGNSAEVVL